MTTRRLLRAIAPLLGLVLLIGLEGCGDDASGCLTRAECGAGEICLNGECTPGDGVDAAAQDAEGIDAPQPDVGPGNDAGPPEMDAGPAVCGAPCTTSNPCEEGAYDCADGEPVCVAVGPAAEGTRCRDVEGQCDVAESCDGVSMVCPDNARMEANTECRAATGVCDVAESCDGISPACPIDAFAATGTTCADGFCDGSGVCSDTCTPGAACNPGVPCRTGQVDCSGGAPSCELMGQEPNGTMCGATENGSWSTCAFDTTCDETGTESRPVTNYACADGACAASVTSEERACSRDTDGAGCGSPTFGAWGSCGGFDSPCDTTGTRSRSVATPTCAGGMCSAVMTTQTENCTRSTNGNSCGSVTNGPWGSCDYANSCDEMASQSRTVTTPTCSSGTCSDVNTTQTQACTRDTDGTSCGSPTFGNWGACGGYSTSCDETGTRTRTRTDRTCVSGGCSDVPVQESGSCTRNTDGIACPGPPCATNQCSNGTCNQSGSCGAGTTCCDFRCLPVCP